ncbi:MAG TPA: ATP-binding protein [Anaerolineales bacterium]|nr:ATP-binding protein [Anaerolineales bacterium]
MTIQFIDRQNELHYFEEFLRKPDFSALLVSGLGGVGKTYMLRHFCEIAADNGHWIHFLPLYTFRGTTELSYLFAEALSSGQYLIGNEINSWKNLLQSSQKISDELLPLIEYPSEANTTKNLKSVVDLITQQIPNGKQLIIVFDALDASENIDRSVSFLEFLIRALANNAKIKLIFSSRPIPNLGRLNRYHNLSTISLNGFSIESVKEFVSVSLSDSRLSKEYLENISRDIAKQSGGLPLFVSLMLEQAKQVGLERTIETLKSPVSIDNIVDKSIKAVTKDNEDILNLLKALALLGGSASKETIRELLNKNQYDFANAVDQASQSFFIRFGGGGSILFVHDVIREFIIRKYIFPNEYKPNLLDFGSEEAERDHLLATNFVFNNALDEIFSGQKNIILGDRGAGKSSIFRFISDVGKFPIPRDKRKQYELLSKKMLVVPCDDPTSIIQDNSFFDDPNTTPEKYKMFWLLYIALLSGIAIYKQGDYTNPANWRDLTDILKSAGVLDKLDGADTSLFKPVLDLITKIGSKVSFSIAGIPITLEPSAELKPEKPSVVIDISKLLELANLNAINLEQRLIILIDRVDEIFKYQREKQERFVQGLFLAISYLSKYSNITLTVFLRTDIFQIYDIQEKNKFVSRSLSLSWNQKDILRLLIRRLGANKFFQGIRPFIKIDGNDTDTKVQLSLMFIFPEQIEGLPFVEWIIKMMRNGKNHISPRQIILFLVIIRDILINSSFSPKQVPIFNDKDVKQAITKLSELSYDEILSDFRISPTFLQNCRSGKISEFSLDEVKGLFSEQEGTIISQLDLLEKLGILERVVKVDSEKGFISKFKFPDLYTRCWFYN